MKTLHKNRKKEKFSGKYQAGNYFLLKLEFSGKITFL
jgi:hypothetical protein